jgi:hypothetical protein
LPEHNRTDSQREALEAEGVIFDESGNADPAQRIDAVELAILAGVDLPQEDLLPVAEGGTGRHETFLAQLAPVHDENTSHGVIATMDAWVGLGGRLDYGRGAETSCFLMYDSPKGAIWPAVIYPSGKFEVVFQYLKDRPPFDQLPLREELRSRLNAVKDVALPQSKIALRPGFALQILAHTDRRAQVVDTLAWFIKEFDSHTP